MLLYRQLLLRLCRGKLQQREFNYSGVAVLAASALYDRNKRGKSPDGAGPVPGPVRGFFPEGLLLL